MQNILRKRQSGVVNIFVALILAILILAVVPIISSTMNSGSLSSAIKLIESEGYVAFAAGEYGVLSIKIDALKVNTDVAATNAANAAIAAVAANDNAVIAATNAANAAIAARNTTETVLAELHAKQLVYPELATPVTLSANNTSWTYGVLTQVIPINIITSNFTIDGISISAMSANADFTVRIIYGAGNTEWSIFALSRGGVQSASTVIKIQGATIPANSVVKMQVADSIGASTLAIKVVYHLTVP